MRSVTCLQASRRNYGKSGMIYLCSGTLQWPERTTWWGTRTFLTPILLLWTNHSFPLFFFVSIFLPIKFLLVFLLCHELFQLDTESVGDLSGLFFLSYNRKILQTSSSVFLTKLGEHCVSRSLRSEKSFAKSLDIKREKFLPKLLCLFQIWMLLEAHCVIFF